MLYGPQVGVGAAPPKEGWVARALPGTGERRRVCSCSARAAGAEVQSWTSATYGGMHGGRTWRGRGRAPQLGAGGG